MVQVSRGIEISWARSRLCGTWTSMMVSVRETLSPGSDLSLPTTRKLSAESAARTGRCSSCRPWNASTLSTCFSSDRTYSHVPRPPPPTTTTNTRTAISAVTRAHRRRGHHRRRRLPGSVSPWGFHGGRDVCDA